MNIQKRFNDLCPKSVIPKNIFDFFQKEVPFCGRRRTRFKNLVANVLFPVGFVIRWGAVMVFWLFFLFMASSIFVWVVTHPFVTNAMLDFVAFKINHALLPFTPYWVSDFLHRCFPYYK